MAETHKQPTISLLIIKMLVHVEVKNAQQLGW